MQNLIEDFLKLRANDLPHLETITWLYLGKHHIKYNLIKIDETEYVLLSDEHKFVTGSEKGKKLWKKL